MTSAQPVNTALEAFKYIVFADPNWDPATFNAATDIERTLRADSNDVLNSSSTDLKAFFDRGGKIIATGGWTDPLISPLEEVNFYNRVRETVGAAQTDRSYKLFMKPGINHCGGGEGADTADLLTVLEDWVERGTAPTRLPARPARRSSSTRSANSGGAPSTSTRTHEPPRGHASSACAWLA